MGQGKTENGRSHTAFPEEIISLSATLSTFTVRRAQMSAVPDLSEYKPPVSCQQNSPDPLFQEFSSGQPSNFLKLGQDTPLGLTIISSGHNLSHLLFFSTAVVIVVNFKFSMVTYPFLPPFLDLRVEGDSTFWPAELPCITTDSATSCPRYLFNNG